MTKSDRTPPARDAAATLAPVTMLGGARDFETEAGITLVGVFDFGSPVAAAGAFIDPHIGVAKSVYEFSEGAASTFKAISPSAKSTFTWMDFVDGAVRGPNHRWQHHHPIDIVAARLDGEQISLPWAAVHLATDVVTTKGLPLFPEYLTGGLRSFCQYQGISLNSLHEWTSVNLWDGLLGSVELVASSADLVYALSDAVTPTLADVAVNVALATTNFSVAWATQNPLFVVAGMERTVVSVESALDIAAPVESCVLTAVIDLSEVIGPPSLIGAAVGFGASMLAGSGFHAASIDGLKGGVRGALIGSAWSVAPPLGVAVSSAMLLDQIVRHESRRIELEDRAVLDRLSSRRAVTPLRPAVSVKSIAEDEWQPATDANDVTVDDWKSAAQVTNVTENEPQPANDWTAVHEDERRPSAGFKTVTRDDW